MELDPMCQSFDVAVSTAPSGPSNTTIAHGRLMYQTPAAADGMDGCRELGSAELDTVPTMTIGKSEKRWTRRRGLSVADEWQIFITRVRQNT